MSEVTDEFGGVRDLLERTASEGRNYMRDASDDEAAVLEDFALHLLTLLDEASVTARSESDGSGVGE